MLRWLTEGLQSVSQLESRSVHVHTEYLRNHS
jgi:hypothetical protein